MDKEIGQWQEREKLVDQRKEKQAGDDAGNTAGDLNKPIYGGAYIGKESTCERLSKKEAPQFKKSKSQRSSTKEVDPLVHYRL